MFPLIFLETINSLQQKIMIHLRRSETSSIVVENQQSTDGNETDVDLDATIFDF